MNLEAIQIKPAGEASARAEKLKALTGPDARALREMCRRIAGNMRLCALSPKNAGPAKRRETLRLALELERLGLAALSFDIRDKSLEKIYKALSEADAVCAREPGFWNVAAYEREWDIWPTHNDYLDKNSPLYALKTFERDIYMDSMRPHLKKLPKKARILDAGGGVGRFSVPLAKMGYDVTLFDASARALKAALRHAAEEKADSLQCLHGDVASLSPLPDNSFDAVFSIEVFCYCTKPEKALAAAVGKLKEGGLLFVSVEGRHGALIADPAIELAEAEQMIESGRIQTDNYVYTTYYTRESFGETLEKAGLEVVEIVGTHYAMEGPLGKLAGDATLNSREGRARLRRIELHCRRDPVFSPLARSWLAIAKKKPSRLC